MALLQPSPVLRRVAFERLAHQVLKLSASTSPSLACFSTSTSTLTSPSTTPPTATTIASLVISRPCLHPKSCTPTLSVPFAFSRSRTAAQHWSPAFSVIRRLNTSSSNKTAAAATFDARYENETASSTSESAQSKAKSFPAASSKSVAYWLLGSAASVFGIVVLGGLTRLTESGYAHMPPCLLRPTTFKQCV